eukprot:m.149755 g.149755  ORF g.149755 m.149755 type:complete len:145 (+) comp9732_c0_seq10:1927-2361(+)
MKKAITLRFCAPPVKAFRAQNSFAGLFFFVLLVMLLLIAFPLGYAITQLPTSGVYQSEAELWVSPSLQGFNTSSACTLTSMMCRTCTASYINAHSSETVCYKHPGASVGTYTTVRSVPCPCFLDFSGQKTPVIFIASDYCLVRC